jgi:hypothetical protein
MMNRQQLVSRSMTLCSLLVLAAGCAAGASESEVTETPSALNVAGAPAVEALTASAAAGGGGTPIGGSVEIKLDLNRWTDQMLGWIHSKSDSDHYHSMSDMWLFFEGNHCSQNVVGSMWTPDHGKFRDNIKKLGWFVNDEARSVLINKGRKGQRLVVKDDPSGGNSDDYADMTIKKNFNGAYCVGTFETNYEDATVKIVYHRKNGLDGKVSYVSNY